MVLHLACADIWKLLFVYRYFVVLLKVRKIMKHKQSETASLFTPSTVRILNITRIILVVINLAVIGIFTYYRYNWFVTMMNYDWSRADTYRDAVQGAHKAMISARTVMIGFNFCIGVLYLVCVLGVWRFFSRD